MMYCVGHKDMFCEIRNFCLVFVFIGGWLVGESQSKKVCSYDLYHRFTCEGQVGAYL